jgi:hypothetical protein
VMGHGLDDRDSIPDRGKFSLFSTESGLALGATQTRIQMLPEIKRQGREGDHSPPSRAKVDNGGAITPLPNASLWHSA